MMAVVGNDPTALGLLGYFALFFLVALFWPTWRLWRRDGTNALVLPRDDSAHGIVGRWFRVTLLAVPIALGSLAAGAPREALGRILWLEIDAARFGGWAILAISLVWIVAAQRQMGASWRVGIESGSQPPLIRNGLFALSRNPIFLGMRLALAGLFLALPNAATLAILLVGEVLMQVQVRLEEEHLSRTLRGDYEAYRTLVRRWL